MGSVLLSSQSLISVEEALAFLQDQGSPTDDQDLLRTHLNAVAGMMVKLTGRDRLIWKTGDSITEYRDGYGSDRLFLKNAPIRSIVSVDLSPNQTTPQSIAVPTPPATFSDECYFDATMGVLVLKSRVFPSGPASVKVVYTAGFYVQDQPTAGSPADLEAAELKMIALNVLARKWSRWKNGRHGIASESRGDLSISFSPDDMTKDEIRELKRYRRGLFA
jgi:hypothetical protein